MVLADSSVSTSHAKLQRREGVWVIVDLDSTNGSYVDGERVQGETPIACGASIRFGDVALVFEPMDDARGVEKGGGTVVLSSVKGPPAPPAPSPPAPPAPSPAPIPAKPPPKAGPQAPPAKAPPKPQGKPQPKPQPKRPQTPPPPEKRGKGCGASAVVLLAGAAGMVVMVYWILA